MTDTLNKLFDGWTDIIEKARKPKGLANWKKLEHVAGKLEGKQISNITFTSAHPSYEGKPVKHTLGSTIGNLHFLLGYANPAFHLAPYHWQIIDPHLTDEDIASLEHPSRPELWERSGLEMEDEGDLEEGSPHPMVASSKKASEAQKKREADSISVTSNGAQFIAVPSELRVYSTSTGHVYNWAVIKESYFAATNPQMKQAMDEAEGDNDENDDLQAKPTVEKSLPIFVHSLMEETEFNNNVFPLIKSVCPKPGSVLQLSTNEDETIYALVKSDCIEFYDKIGNPVHIPVYDRVYKSFDLTVDGNIHPSILFNFISTTLKLDKSHLNTHIEETNSSNFLIKGIPTPGFDSVSPEEGTMPEDRVVSIFGNSYRVYPRVGT